MKASLRALLSGVIDYAGLFPPAALSLDQSIRNYAKYVESDDRLMLGRFICPVAKLAELLPYLPELFNSRAPLRVSVLGTGGTSDAEFNTRIELDFAAMASFRDATRGLAVIDGFETKIPASGGMRLPGPSRDVFIEPTMGANWRDAIRFVAKLRSTGFKLRTGGVEASAFPSVEQVAFAIATCARAGKHMKFTAGLHHPIRHYNESVNTKMHGFINVFVAGVLGNAKRLDESSLVAILADEQPTNFQFDNDGLAWRDYRVAIAEIQSARRDRVISFGSCSFDEPREDLRALGWL